MMSEEDDEDILTPVFHTLDYVSLLIVIVASIMIGLYYSIFKKDITTEGYLFGNRKLKVFPVALSIMVSILSCITLIAHPAEVYRYGSDFWYLPFALLAADIIICYFYAPVLFNLKCVTLNEYLEKRFNRSIRTFCSIIYTVNTILLMPVIMCISSLALTQVSGINFHIITTVSGLITTFYTTIGGIRAVVWTDVLQTLFIFLGIIVLAVKGTMDVGGIRNVWIVNYENYRIVPPKYALDLTERYNIREWIIGASISGVAYRGVNQGTVQRILCVPNLEAAKRCLVIGGICSLVCSVMSNYIGLLAFAAFKDCDPLSSHKISTGDQLVPLFVTYTLRNSPGLSGIIIAAFMSATLSTVSTQLNSTAAIVLNDFYKLFINEDVSEKIASIIMKSTVVIIGVLTIFSVFIVKEMGSIVQVFFMFTTILNGPLLGIFTIGMYLPRIKSRAALIGSLCGLIFITWISIGGQIARSSGLIPLNTKPVFVHGCKGNITLANSTTTSTEQVLVLYRISSLWHTPIGCLITMLTSWILSIFIKNNDVSSMDPNLYSPFLQRNIPQQQKEINETEMSLLNCKRNE